MTDPILLALTHLSALLLGWFIGSELWASRRARLDTICPTCLAATDDDGVHERLTGPDMAGERVELSIPSDWESVLQQYQRESVVREIVDVDLKRCNGTPETIIRQNRGSSLRVRPEQLGLIDHDKELEEVAWPDNVRTVSADRHD